MKLMRQKTPLCVESEEDALMSCEWNGSYQMLPGSVRLIRRYQLTYKQDVQLHSPSVVNIDRTVYCAVQKARKKKI